MIHGHEYEERQKKLHKEKGAYLGLVKLIMETMARDIGSTEADLYIPIEEIKTIPHLDLQHHFWLLTHNGVLKTIRDQKGRYHPFIVEKPNLRVHCMMDSRMIFEYMIKLPGYELFYGKPKRNPWGMRVGEVGLQKNEPIPPRLIGSKKRVRAGLASVKLPDNATWDKLHLKLKEGLKEVEVLYSGKHFATYDYEKLGFGVKKSTKKSMAWMLLEVLAAYRFNPTNRPNMQTLAVSLGKVSGKKVTLDTLYKEKQHLSEDLCYLFGINESPFTDNKTTYELKFTLDPIPVLRGTGEVWITEGGRPDAPDSDNPYEDETPF